MTGMMAINWLTLVIAFQCCPQHKMGTERRERTNRRTDILSNSSPVKRLPIVVKRSVGSV